VDTEKRLLIATVLVLFATSCCLSAFWGRGGFLEGGTDLYGWQLVLFGWFPVLPFWVPWTSNIFLAFSVHRLWKGRDMDARGFALTAVVFASIPLVMLLTRSDQLELRSGYYFWLASLMTWSAGLFYLPHKARRMKPSTAKALRDEL
jgi:hypothetical protein